MLILSLFLKKVECDSAKNDSSYARKYQDHILCGFAYEVVFIDNKFSKKVTSLENMEVQLIGVVM